MGYARVVVAQQQENLSLSIFDDDGNTGNAYHVFFVGDFGRFEEYVCKKSIQGARQGDERIWTASNRFIDF